jgi:hypothetical protein
MMFARDLCFFIGALTLYDLFLLKGVMHLT